jgi:hypothetical protein
LLKRPVATPIGWTENRSVGPKIGVSNERLLVRLALAGRVESRPFPDVFRRVTVTLCLPCLEVRWRCGLSFEFGP